MSPARTVDRPTELLAWLFEAWPEAKKKQVRTWLKFGSVVVNGRVVTQFDHPLKPGDTVAIRAKGMAAPDTALPSGIRIRHEDESILVIEKPAGLLSIASASEPERTAYAALTDHVRRGNKQGRERVWIVHRLDRETSGLMVFAKSEEAKRALQENWDAAEKKYLAVVEGTPPSTAGKLESDLDESNPLKVYVAEKKGPETRHAVTRYRVTKTGKATTLVELTLETGRRHQIRVQLAEAGCPIVGDGKYGAETKLKRIALHATSLRFPHPTSDKAMSFQSPLPGDLGRLV